MYSFILFLVVLALLFPVSAYAAIPASVLRTYPVIGSQTTTDVINKVINMQGHTQLSLILTASGGNFNSTTMAISVSQDNSTFITVDSVSLSTGTSIGEIYSDSLKSTTLVLNPALFPFVKVTTSANVSGVTETLYWVAGS